MNRLAVRMVLAISASVALASGHGFARSVPDRTTQTLAELRALHQAQEVAQLRAELSKVKQELEAVKAAQQAWASPAAAALPSVLPGDLAPGPIGSLVPSRIGGLTPSRILTPNPQGYWLRLRQPETGTTWSLASEPANGLLRFGSDAAPESSRLRVSGDGSVWTGPLGIGSEGTATASADMLSNPLSLRASFWDQDTQSPADATVTWRLWPWERQAHVLSLTEPHGSNWLWLFMPHDNPGSPEVQIYGNDYRFQPLNLCNFDPTGDIALRFRKADASNMPCFFPSDWIIYIDTGENQYDFSIIRDYWFTALRLDEEGRMLVGYLNAEPRDEPDGNARFQVRGYLDEVQAMVEGAAGQMSDLFQVVSAGRATTYLSVDHQGDTLVGDPAHPRALVLHDVVDGTPHYLQVNNGQLELVSP